MKKRGLLHPQLSRLVAELGHGDGLAVVDAGFPVPVGVERVDLAFAPGHPGLLDVLSALLPELRVETYVLAEEARTACPQIVSALAEWLPDAGTTWVVHEELKRLSRTARGIVRTGEFTPYANVVLRSGVVFPAV